MGCAVREDLKTARRCLDVVQRSVLRDHLGQLEAFLRPAETVQRLGPGSWQARRDLMVLNIDRLLLVRRQLKCSPTDQASFFLKTITHQSTHAVPRKGARIRFTVVLNAEKFTVTGRGAEFAHVLRAVTR